MDKVIDYMADSGSWIIGTPDDCIEGIKKLGERSGGFGAFLVQTVDWAPREKMLRSYELLARYVMPHFQGTALSTAASNRWAMERQEDLVQRAVKDRLAAICASVLTITVPRDPSAGPSDLQALWDIAEESAATHGKQMNRDDWRLVLPVHLAETREEAFADARMGAGRYLREYSEGTNGRKAVFDGPLDKVIDYMADSGSWIIGTPDDCIEGIKKLGERSGGFGAFLVQTVDWAPREKMLRSYELLARYVMPHFQGTALSTAASNRWAMERQEDLVSGRVRAIDRANQAYANRPA